MSSDLTDLVRRLRASLRMDAINGDSMERSVCAKQMREAADCIERLSKAEPAAPAPKSLRDMTEDDFNEALGVPAPDDARDAQRYRYLRDYGDEVINGVQVQITKYGKLDADDVEQCGVLYVAADQIIDRQIAAMKEKP